MLFFEKQYPAKLEEIRRIHTDFKPVFSKLQLSLTDQDRFSLCVSEILTNAIKHGEKQPSYFTINLKYIHNHLELCLQDDGSAFDDFSSIVKSSNDRENAMLDGDLQIGGIGLSLACNNFDTANYQRENGKNYYTFSLSYLLKNKKTLVLIIDDDVNQCLLIKEYLKNDYHVEYVHSGQSGLNFLKQTDTKPNIILCDVIMNEGSGIDFCKSIQKNKEDGLIPFIFMTGNPDNHMAEEAEDLPINDFLEKPINKNKLVKIIRRILKKSEQDRRLISDKLSKEVTDMLSPSLPKNIGPYSIQLKWEAAEEGGGDMVLHFSQDTCDHIIIIDVMGHGVDAKFFAHNFAGYLNGLLKSTANKNSPSTILSSLSNFLFEDEISQKTVLTAQVISIHKNGQIEIASAGHPAPYLYNETNSNFIKVQGSMPGLSAYAEYSSLSLEPLENQIMYLYTDGIMEVGKDANAMQNYEESFIQMMKQGKDIDTLWSAYKNEISGIDSDDALIISIYKS